MSLLIGELWSIRWCRWLLTSYYLTQNSIKYKKNTIKREVIVILYFKEFWNYINCIIQRSSRRVARSWRRACTSSGLSGRTDESPSRCSYRSFRSSNPRRSFSDLWRSSARTLDSVTVFNVDWSLSTSSMYCKTSLKNNI